MVSPNHFSNEALPDKTWKKIETQLKKNKPVKRFEIRDAVCHGVRGLLLWVSVISASLHRRGNHLPLWPFSVPCPLWPIPLSIWHCLTLSTQTCTLAAKPHRSVKPNFPLQGLLLGHLFDLLLDACEYFLLWFYSSFACRTSCQCFNWMCKL